MQQLTRGVKPPLGVIFDTDIGLHIDSALALAILYAFDAKNQARVTSVSVGRTNLGAAAFCDAVARFYAAGGFMRSLPVGMSIAGWKTEDTPMLSVPLSKKNPDGQPAYKHTVADVNDTADVAALIRNALTAQYDGNCVAVLAGPATNLASVLPLPRAKELIAAKLKFLVVSLGAFPSGEPDPRLQADIASARRLLAEWPGPIVASGHEVSKDVLFPGASIERDFAWTQAHPIVDAYRAYKTMPYDAATRDMSAMLYAVRPQEGYFKLSGPGTISVTDDGRAQFTEASDGRHRYLISDPAQKERIVKTYTELAAIKPVPRRFGRPPQQQQQQQQQQPVPVQPPQP
jgi:hypothetical protein